MKSQTGGVLLFVVIFSFSISIITITLLTAMSNTTKSVSTLSDIDLLRQQNSAAIRATIDKLAAIDKVDELPNTVTVLDREVSVTVLSTQGEYWRLLQLKVSSEGNHHVHTVSQYVDKQPPMPFNYTIYAEDSISLDSVGAASSVTGSPYAIYVENNLELKHKNDINANKAKIEGWLSYSSEEPNFNITGYEKDEFNWLPVKKPKFPTFNHNKAKVEATSSNCYEGSDISITASTLPLDYQCGDVYFVDGDLTVFGDITFDGIVVVTGTLNIIVNSNITHGENGLLLVADEIRIDLSALPVIGKTTINGILFTPNDVQGLLGKADINGSIVAKNVKALDQLNVTYDEDLVEKIPISVWNMFDEFEMHTFNWEETVN